MAIGDLQFNPYLNQNLNQNNANRLQFGSLTGVGAKQPQQTQQLRQLEKQPQAKPLQFKEYSPEDLIQAQAIAETFAPKEEQQGFLESLKTDFNDIWNAAATMFAEPTQEELNAGFKEIDSFSALKPENYYKTVDTNKEVVPFYDDKDYQFVA